MQTRRHERAGCAERESSGERNSQKLAANKMHCCRRARPFTIDTVNLQERGDNKTKGVLEAQNKNHCPISTEMDPILEQFETEYRTSAYNFFSRIQYDLKESSMVFVI
jgi:hypothetical protein